MATVKAMNRKQLIDLMRKRQGKRTAREFAEELGISSQYISDIYSGKRAPGRAVLDKLQLERNVIYKPTKSIEAESLA